MSENRGKAKVKTKSKSIAKNAGKNKAAVMNSRNPKKPMAISGDTMSNYAMYKKGGKVSKIKKYQTAGPVNTSGPRAVQEEMDYYADPERNEIRRNYIENGNTKKVRATLNLNKAEAEDGKDYQKQSQYKRITVDKLGGSAYKKGGVTKAKKFAALAPPYNKATAADRIAGAKKNSKKK